MNSIAIVALTRGYNEISKYNSLINRNKKLYEHYIENADYVLFHEGNIKKEHQDYIQKQTPKLPLKFINVEKSFINFDTRQFDKSAKSFKLGYRNMCNFWFCEFWNYVEKYGKIIRIDEDCFIDSDIGDIFKNLDKYLVIYPFWSPDRDRVTKGLNQFTINFFEKYNGMKITPKKPSGPYTNLIAFNLKNLKENDLLKAYIDKVRSSKNIFIYRWGDLPLWGEVLTYILNENTYYLDKSIKYYHESHKTYVKDGERCPL